jgi:hypothetical protein
LARPRTTALHCYSEKYQSYRVGVVFFNNKHFNSDIKRCLTALSRRLTSVSSLLKRQTQKTRQTFSAAMSDGAFPQSDIGEFSPQTSDVLGRDV